MADSSSESDADSLDDSSAKSSSSSEDEFEESGSKETDAKRGGDVKNMPFDEALDVSASFSVAENSPPKNGGGNSIRNKPFDEAMSVASDEGEESLSTNPSPRQARLSNTQAKQDDSSAEESSEEEESSSDEEAKGVGVAAATAAIPAGAYDPSQMDHLQVSAEIRELFQYIKRYKPQDIELDSKIKCFIPDYVPSVGLIDNFLKVPRPDGQMSTLGLTVLDEPASNQSDSTVLDLQIRAVSKRQHGDAAVRSIDNAHKDPAAIQRWIDNLHELNRSKPRAQVNYTKAMPEIEPLMQVWPEEVEEVLSSIQLPGVEMDLSLEEYAKLLCNIVDIPVHGNITESLHVLFTLYSEFKSNQHFMGMQPEGPARVAEVGGAMFDFGAAVPKEADPMATLMGGHSEAK